MANPILSNKDEREKLTIFVPTDKIKEFKIKAIQSDMTVSDYLTTAATISSPEQVRSSFQATDNLGTAADDEVAKVFKLRS